METPNTENRTMYRLAPGRQLPGHPEVDSSYLFEATDECVIKYRSIFSPCVASEREEDTVDDTEEGRADLAEKQAERAKAEAEAAKHAPVDIVNTMKKEYEDGREEIKGYGSDENIPDMRPCDPSYSPDKKDDKDA